MAQESILQLLQHKIDLLDGVIDLTTLQHKLIAAEEVQLLMENIAKRQELIDTLDNLEVVIASCPPPTEREMASYEAAMNDIRSQLEDIQAQDKRNEQLAASHLERYRQEVRSANDFIRVVEGYIDPLFPDTAHFIDKRK